MLVEENEISYHIGKLIPRALSCRIGIEVNHLRAIHGHQERGVGRDDELTI